MSPPTAYAIGTDPSANTRPRSAPIMTRRRRMRSTQTPAGNPTTKKAAVDAAVNRPISNAVACSVRTASNGMASRLTCEPNSLTVSPPHNSRKSRCRSSTPPLAIERTLTQQRRRPTPLGLHC